MKAERTDFLKSHSELGGSRQMEEEGSRPGAGVWSQRTFLGTDTAQECTEGERQPGCPRSEEPQKAIS